MKKRYLYVLLFGLPALLVAVIIATLLFGAAAGILWIFVFGDNPWPASAGTMLTTVLVSACITLWVGLLSAAYRFGIKQEEQASLNTRHVWAAVGGTVLLVLLVVAHQWSVGNLGPKSAGELCADFCQEKGYAGSGMPPRDAGAATCSCFDAHGRETVTVPMGEITVRQGK
ncbi:MAG: hypothetical protein NDI73_04100 [Desulfuromonadales bacterium]|nr:hypothetical protein [Desulfuromonadales bacterium]